MKTFKDLQVGDVVYLKRWGSNIVFKFKVEKIYEEITIKEIYIKSVNGSISTSLYLKKDFSESVFNPMGTDEDYYSDKEELIKRIDFEIE